MKYLPNSVSRAGYKTALKLSAKSPTILVVAGVVGLGATAFLAAKATRKLDPILDDHSKMRIMIEETVYETDKERQRALAKLYTGTTVELGKLYGPTVFVGATSAIAVLGGHKIIRGRQIATMAAYSGLMDQFRSYRGRVARTIGEDLERNIFEGAHGEWVEDPAHKGELKLEAKFEPDPTGSYLRPWFDSSNPNWTRDPQQNYLFLKGVQQHMNNKLQIKHHVMLNDVLDALGMPRCPEGAVSGWLYETKVGDGFIDFGFMTSQDPHSAAFRAYEVRDVQLNFNIDGVVWTQI